MSNRSCSSLFSSLFIGGIFPQNGVLPILSSPNYPQVAGTRLNVRSVCAKDASLIIRFGGINERKADSLEILKLSLKNSGWCIDKIEDAGSASLGHRQALHINNSVNDVRQEFDIWATWN